MKNRMELKMEDLIVTGPDTTEHALDPREVEAARYDKIFWDAHNALGSIEYELSLPDNELAFTREYLEGEKVRLEKVKLDALKARQTAILGEEK